MLFGAGNSTYDLQFLKGPGGGCDPWYRQFFDQKAYRVIIFDQRGAG